MSTTEREFPLLGSVDLILHQLHITGNLRGFHYLAYAIERAVTDPRCVLSVTKELYPEIGRRFGVSAASVERSIRVAIAACWERGGRDALTKLACCQLVQRPYATEFIDMVASYLRRACPTAPRRG